MWLSTTNHRFWRRLMSTRCACLLRAVVSRSGSGTVTSAIHQLLSQTDGAMSLHWLSLAACVDPPPRKQCGFFVAAQKPPTRRASSPNCSNQLSPTLGHTGRHSGYQQALGSFQTRRGSETGTTSATLSVSVASAPCSSRPSCYSVPLCASLRRNPQLLPGNSANVVKR